MASLYPISLPHYIHTEKGKHERNLRVRCSALLPQPAPVELENLALVASVAGGVLGLVTPDEVG